MVSPIILPREEGGHNCLCDSTCTETMKRVERKAQCKGEIQKGKKREKDRGEGRKSKQAGQRRVHAHYTFKATQ